jgi:hypothetical protein
VNDGMVPLGSVPLIEDGKGPLKWGGGSVGMKSGGECPKGVGPPRVSYVTCVGEGKCQGDSGRKRCANGGLASHGNPSVKTHSIFVMDNL